MNDAKVSEFLEDIEEITETISKIKGPVYTNGLFIILNLINFTEMATLFAREGVNSKENQKAYVKISSEVVVDTYYRVAYFICNTKDEEKLMPLMEELHTDVTSIIRKQKQYTGKKEDK